MKYCRLLTPDATRQGLDQETFDRLVSQRLLSVILRHVSHLQSHRAFTLFYPKLCGHLCHRSNKWFLGCLFPSINPEGFFIFVTKLSDGSQDSQNSPEKTVFSQILAYYPLLNRFLQEDE